MFVVMYTIVLFHYACRFVSVLFFFRWLGRRRGGFLEEAIHSVGYHPWVPVMVRRHAYQQRGSVEAPSRTLRERRVCPSGGKNWRGFDCGRSECAKRGQNVAVLAHKRTNDRNTENTIARKRNHLFLFQKENKNHLLSMHQVRWTPGYMVPHSLEARVDKRESGGLSLGLLLLSCTHACAAPNIT